MKRCAALIMAALMLFCLLPRGEARAAADYSWIKVKLSTNNATALTIYVSGTYFIKENGAEFTGGTVTVRSNFDGTMTLAHSALGNLYTGAALSIMRANVDRDAGYLKLNGRCYLGHFNLKYISSGYIRVVNEAPLAHYLYGVVGHEMSNTFPIEALKAQAIAAKCYVLTRLSMSGDYYIGDTSSEQVYKGYTASYSNVIQAVDSTLNEVLSVNGQLLCTYYAASNGGETLLPTQAWPSKNVSNDGYGITLDPYDLANAYSKKESIKIPVGMGGSISQTLMSMLLSKASMAVGYQVDQINGISGVSMDSPRYSGTTRDMTRCTIALTVSQSGVNPVDVTLTFGVDEFAAYGVTVDSTLRAYWGEMTSSGYYYIYHLRYGHGVGMSQRGAQARASEGHSYKDILGFYYPGASFSTISVSAPENPVNSAAQNAPQGEYVMARSTGNVRMRSGPATSYSSLGTVPEGADLYVFSSENGWAYAAYEGKAGYISEKYVEYLNGRPEAEASPSPTPTTGQEATHEGVVAFGVVNGSGVNLRNGPSTSHTSMAKLAYGTQLYIFGSTNGWYQVAAPDGRQGYMISTYVSITGYPSTGSDADQEQEVGDPEAPPTPTPGPTDPPLTEPQVIGYGRVTGQGVNFRTGPATSYQSLTRLDRDTEIEIYSLQGSWYYGKAEGMVGYISGGYVALTDNPASAVTPTPAISPTPMPTIGVEGGATPAPTQMAAPEDTAAPTPTPTPDNHTTINVGRINASGVNMRIGPGNSYVSLRKLSKDTGVYILGSNGDWYNVQTGSLKGYVYRTYVTITGTEEVDGSGNPVESQTRPEGATGKGATTGSVRLRKGPGTSYGIVTTMSRDTGLTLYGLTGGWYSVKLADGTAGYASSKYVTVTEAYASVEEPAGDAETETAMGAGKTTTNVNFRQSPSTQAKKLTTLPKGTGVTLYSLDNGWYEAEYRGTRGYLYAKYVAKTADAGNATAPGNADASGQDTTVSTEGQSGAVTLTKGVATANVNFRSGPSTSGTTVYETLDKGTAVEIIGQTGTWYYVISGGRAGFLSSAYVKVSAAGSVGVQAVSGSITPQSCKTIAKVNLRTGPSTGHSKITLLPEGTALTVYYVSGEWCFVNCNGVYGFAYDDYIAVA